MAKRSSNERSGKSSRVKEKEVVEEPQTVRIVLLKDLKLRVPGEGNPLPSGNSYFFGGAGSIVEIDIRDKDRLLSKMGSKACCPGSVGPTPYFEIVN